MEKKKKKVTKKSEAGKGDSPRPFSISQEEFKKRWNIAFGKKKRRKKKITKKKNSKTSS